MRARRWSRQAGKLEDWRKPKDMTESLQLLIIANSIVVSVKSYYFMD